MQEAFPNILCLDAMDPAVWRRLSAWANMLDDEPDTDRTLMYRQREERVSFTGKEEGEAVVDPNSSRSFSSSFSSHSRGKTT